MWAKVESGSITEIYTSPKRLTIGDTQYPSNIFQLWEAAELRAIGIYPVVMDNSNLKNKEFYNNTNITYTVGDGNVVGTYGTATAKSMNDVLCKFKKRKMNFFFINITTYFRIWFVIVSYYSVFRILSKIIFTLFPSFSCH